MEKENLLNEYAAVLDVYNQLNDQAMNQLQVSVFQNLTIKVSDIRKKINEHYRDLEMYQEILDELMMINHMIDVHGDSISKFQMTFTRKIKFPIAHSLRKFMRELGYHHTIYDYNHIHRFDKSLNHNEFLFGYTRKFNNYKYYKLCAFCFIRCKIIYQDSHETIIGCEVYKDELNEKMAQVNHAIAREKQKYHSDESFDSLKKEIDRDQKINKLMMKIYQDLIQFTIQNPDIKLISNSNVKSIY